MNRFPPYVLLITLVGGVGDRAAGSRRLSTSVEAGGAGTGWRHYIIEQYTTARSVFEWSGIRIPENIRGGVSLFFEGDSGNWRGGKRGKRTCDRTRFRPLDDSAVVPSVRGGVSVVGSSCVGSGPDGPPGGGPEGGSSCIYVGWYAGSYCTKKTKKTSVNDPTTKQKER